MGSQEGGTGDRDWGTGIIILVSCSEYIDKLNGLTGLAWVGEFPHF